MGEGAKPGKGAAERWEKRGEKLSDREDLKAKLGLLEREPKDGTEWE